MTLEGHICRIGISMNAQQVSDWPTTAYRPPLVCLIGQK